MKYAPLALLLAVFPLFAYELSPQECARGARIAGMAAAERDKGVSREKLIRDTHDRKSDYTNPDHYEITLQIVDTVYDMPELSRAQHEERFRQECISTEGAMHSRT